MTTIESTVAKILGQTTPGVAEAVRERWDSLTKPRGSLGRLEEAIVRLAQIQGLALPRIERCGIYVFCGDHGITDEGVSPYPSVVTQEMVKNFLRGGAAINVLCRELGMETCVVDSGVAGPKLDGVLYRRIANGTQNFLRAPAMSREQAVAAIQSGIDLALGAARRFDVVGVGEMGIGNSTSASALLSAFTGAPPEQTVGRGAGLDETGIQRKCAVVREALALHRPDAADPLHIVACLGGFEIAMMGGFFLGAAGDRLPVVVDGFISGAAFLIARAFCPAISERVFFAHESAERGNGLLLTTAGAKPLLNLEMCLGEGTGAAIAIGILRSGMRLYLEMATFAEAGVSDLQSKEEIEQ
jgi:nicotinate-nucleotide--dimethylbenzimidazole phosphoribosyltransferase